ncbi:MAG TPA: MFS transporter [Bryobacteraceae bacterium]|nr:MFS transporter [Bryobacteraceae bacterium]
MNTRARIWGIVGLLCLANIVAYVDRINLSFALADADFRRAFALSDTDRGNLNSAFFWTYAFLQIPAGALVDRFGVKYPYALGLLFWSLISAGTGFASAVWQLFAVRLLLGVGEAALTPGALRWIRFHIPEKQRGLATGLFFAGAKLGPAVGSYLAALLIHDYGWRTMFVILGLGSLLWLIPWMLAVRDDDRQLESEAARAAAGPAMPFSYVFRSPVIYGVIIGTFAYNYFNYFCLTWLPAYFVERWHMSLKGSGLYTSFSFVGFAAVAIAGGIAADRIIARGADAAGVRKAFTIAGLAVAASACIGPLSGSRQVALAFAIVSLTGLGLATANYWALTQTLMPGAAIGRIAGVQNFASNLSGIVAPTVTGWLVQRTGSYDAPIVAASVILLIGVLAYAVLVRRPNDKTDRDYRAAVVGGNVRSGPGHEHAEPD